MAVTEFDKMVQFMDLAWMMRDQIVPCLVGPPGIGKTAAVQLHAKRHNCGKVVKIVASRCVPSETVGMTMPDHEHRSMDIYNSMQLSSLEDGDILFLDELLEADQFVLSTLLTVIESREMADGTPLPDIQIVAATNDTIPPEQLKGNIRQRFMFERFVMDSNATRQYIIDKTGIVVPDEVLRSMKIEGSDYNFLTPRSLTKLCLWVDACDEDRLGELANQINDIWRTTIGAKLVDARRARDKRLASPEMQIKDAVSKMVPDIADDIKDVSMTELLDILKGLPDWPSIELMLSEMTIKEQDESDVEIKF